MIVSERADVVRPGEGESGPPLWLTHLERAHDAARSAARSLESADVPELDLRPAARAVEQALRHVLSAIDLRVDRMHATHDAVTALDEAAAAVDALGESTDPALGAARTSLRAARAAVMAGLERVALLVPSAPVVAPDLLANTTNVPRVIAIDRPTLVAPVRVPEPQPTVAEPIAPAELPPPKSFDELNARFDELRERQASRRRAAAQRSAASLVANREPEREVPPGFLADFRPAITELAFVHDKTRDFFEEVATLGTHRAPLLGDPWRSSLILEQRLLMCIDAIAAMGPPALERLVPLVLDSPAKDPSRIFALTMVLGCFDGRDALAAAERVALETLDDPTFAEGFANALKLVPNPHLPLAMRTLLSHPEASHRAVAIDVLGYRGLATPEELGRAVHDHPVVAAAALPHYALSREPGVREVVDIAVASDDEALERAGWLAMILTSHPHVASTFAKNLDRPDTVGETAALWLALVGDGQDAQQLLERAQAAPTRALVGAVGWAGLGAAVPALIGLLRNKSREVRLAVAYALERITGAGMYEEVEVEVEDIDAPEIPEPKLPEDERPPPLAALVSDPRDQPEPPAAEVVEHPTTDVARWREFWQQRRTDFRPDARYRRGHPYTPIISLRELDGLWPATPPERRNLQRELVFRTGSCVRTDVHDFVVVQEQAIAQWEPIASSASSSPGAWVAPRRR